MNSNIPSSMSKIVPLLFYKEDINWIYSHTTDTINKFAQSAIEYTDCFSAEG